MRLLLFFAGTICLSFSSFSQQSYYSDVDLNLTGVSLKNELASKVIATHSQFLSYSQIWEACKATDVNPHNNTEVLLVYGWENGSDNDATNNRTRGINNNGGSVGDWNREHVYSRSLGTPNLGDTGPGSDAHHLRPADTQRNSSRNNKKFATGSGTSSGAVTNGWYPGDEWKGDVARMMMYMYIRYNNRCLPTNVGVGNASATPDDMIDLFLQWNADDPVSDFEKQRNTYHENTSNAEAQGNRNPFIDNPRLATRIWGGPEAEDLWGIYSISDSEAPTTPTNVSISNITTFSVDITWTAATDNIGVTNYDVFVNGILTSNVTSTATTISGLNSNTTYSFTVLAKDAANNSSNQTNAVNATTLPDNQAPTTPTNVVVSNETGSTFIVNWNASTDNTAVDSYDIYIDGTLNGNATDTFYTVTNLSISTTYAVQILAKDAVNNQSNLSVAINATTTDGSTTTANELFFSEYVEGSSNNKALEIANFTDANIDLSLYAIKRQHNGGQDGGEWDNTLQLSGMLLKNDVFVIINGSSSLQELIDNADFVQPNASETNWGAPINFNGNDPVGLFKNDVLIDVIGTFDAGSSNFAKDKTLRRKSDVTQPNTAFDLDNEWDIYAKDTVDDIGSHNTSLSTENNLKTKFYIYPNPVDNFIFIKGLENNTLKEIIIYNVLGKQIASYKNPTEKIAVKFLEKGIYMLKLVADKEVFSLKFIKK